MRSALPLLMLAACGAPAFVPVTFTMTDELGAYDLIADARLKLNPKCTENCETGQAIEDGGCSRILVNGSGVTCDPDGPLFLVFEGAAFDGGSPMSPARNLAPGSELRLLFYNGGECSDAGLVVPISALEVSVTRTASSCTVTTN